MVTALPLLLFESSFIDSLRCLLMQDMRSATSREAHHDLYVKLLTHSADTSKVLGFLAKFRACASFPENHDQYTVKPWPTCKMSRVF